MIKFSTRNSNSENLWTEPKSGLMNFVFHLSATPGMKPLSTSYKEGTVYFVTRNREVPGKRISQTNAERGHIHLVCSLPEYNQRQTCLHQEVHHGACS